jgi:hypothetical protein
MPKQRYNANDLRKDFVTNHNLRDLHRREIEPGSPDSQSIFQSGDHLSNNIQESRMITFSYFLKFIYNSCYYLAFEFVKKNMNC